MKHHRTLLLLRHAKSSWAAAGIDDFDRPLAPRGRRGIAAVAEHMRARGLAPDAVLCSPARRTRETLDLLRPALAAAAPVRHERRLYLGSAETLLKEIGRVGNETKTLLLVGHNPGMQLLALRLARTGDPVSIDRLGDKFPTAALAIIDFEARSWSDIDGGGALTALVTPRDLLGEDDD